MSTPNSSRLPANLEQQRKLAKDLIRAARDGDAAALARIRAVRSDAAAPPRSLKLADAQLAVAREAGFESWPKLVADLQERDVKAFCDAVRGGDVPRTQQLLALDHVRTRINDPMFDFGQRAAHIAAKNAALLTTLIDAGADVNLKSDWENGPYTVLDNADEDTARFLLARGATLTPNVAARLGWLDELRTLVDADGALVHARGGDGQQPLHEAKTVAIADFLLDRGAGIDVRCIDHKSTPAQYALVDRPDVCRRLLERGATPDIFMAARLGDVALATRLLDADPACVAARINEPGYRAGAALQHLLLVARVRHVAARRRVEVRSSRCPRSARGPKPGTGPIHQRPPGRGRARGERGARRGSVAPAVADAPGARSPGARDLPRAVRRGRPHAPSRVRSGRARHRRRDGAARRLLGGQRADGRTPARARRRAARRQRSDPSEHAARMGRVRIGASPRPQAPTTRPSRTDSWPPAPTSPRSGNGDGRTLLEMAQGNPAMQAALRRLGAA